MNDATAAVSGTTITQPPAPPADMLAKALVATNAVNSQSAKVQRSGSKIGTWMVGHVVRATGGNFDLLVKVPDVGDLLCTYAPGELARYMGAKNCSLPPEMTQVLVYKDPNAADGAAIVVACVPHTMQGIGGKKSEMKKSIKMFAQQFGGENGAGLPSLEGMFTPPRDDKNLKTLRANSGRPLDILPGDLAWINDAGGILALMHFMSALGSSERARIETYVFDDLVRVVSGNWQHWHAMGDTSILEDNGYATMEMSGSWFYPETLGEQTFTQTTADQDKKKETTAQGPFQFKPSPDSARVAKHRFQLFMGALGDMFQLFVCNPADGTVELAENQSKRPSMLQMAVRGNGEVCLRSAAGFSFERNDCLPTPKRMKDPSDPSGDVVDDKTLGPKVPYRYDESNPFARNLEMRDAEAWERAQDCQRFDELAKDFYVPEESDIDAPKDAYDLANLASQFPFQANKGKKAGFRVGPDGSVHIYDAWGGEICMRGGVVLISAPGAVLTQSGGSIVNMGKNVIMKAQQSMDLTAASKDIRISGKGNVWLHSREKGILLQSDAESDGSNFTAGVTGEQSSSAGIVLKAKSAPIFIWGKDLVALSERNIFVQALQAGSGQLIASVKGIVAAGQNITLTAAKSSCLVLSAGIGALCGRAALLAGQGSVAVTRGGSMMVPYEWASSADIYSILEGRFGTALYNMYYSQDAWMSTYASAHRDPIMFSYRSSQEYGTDRPMETDPLADSFKLYESLWQHELRTDNNPFTVGSQDTWTEDAINGTYPWPGAGVRDTAYSTLDAYQYVKPGADHYAGTGRAGMNGKGVVQRIKSFVTKSMDAYIIRK